MAQEEKTLGREMIEAIVSEMIHKDGSPYKQMLGKIGSVHVDYFGNIEMGNMLAKELNMELKEKVVKELKMKFEELLADTGTVETVMNKVMTLVEKARIDMGKDAANKELMKVANNLVQYANNRLLFIPEPPCREEELKEKYEQAKRITVMEHIMQNNEKDVIDFYRALIGRTEWECRNQIERQTSQVLRDLAEIIEKI
jgi:hypothetical protein